MISGSGRQVNASHPIVVLDHGVDKAGYGKVQCILLTWWRVLVRSGRIHQQSDNFFLRQHLLFLQCKQQCLADGECGGAGGIIGGIMGWITRGSDQRFTAMIDWKLY